MGMSGPLRGREALPRIRAFTRRTLDLRVCFFGFPDVGRQGGDSLAYT